MLLLREHAERRDATKSHSRGNFIWWGRSRTPPHQNLSSPLEVGARADETHACAPHRPSLTTATAVHGSERRLEGRDDRHLLTPHGGGAAALMLNQIWGMRGRRKSSWTGQLTFHHLPMTSWTSEPSGSVSTSEPAVRSQLLLASCWWAGPLTPVSQ